MTPESQRIALAKWAGLTVCTHRPSRWERRGPEGDAELWCLDCKQYLSNMRIPDYLHDLNAVWELVMNLKDIDRMGYLTYANKLRRIVGWHNSSASNEDLYEIDATAPQRCESLLRTLGLWED